MQRLRDNPASADSEFSMIRNDKDLGLSFRLTFDLKDNVLPLAAMLSSPFVKAPRVAIRREYGVNGHAEMAFRLQSCAALILSTSTGLDIPCSRSLADFTPAWSRIGQNQLLTPEKGNARLEFQKNPLRTQGKTFTLGSLERIAKNAKQKITELTIPGGPNHLAPQFVDKRILAKFEVCASLYVIRVRDTNTKELPSVFLHGMNGSSLPISVGHGERGPSEKFSHPSDLQALNEAQMIPIRYVILDDYGEVTMKYPANPNGSPEGIAGAWSQDGSIIFLSALMPYPERTIMADVGS